MNLIGSEYIAVSMLALAGCVAFIAMLYSRYYFPWKRKQFLIKEMGHALQTREQIFGADLINHCRTILHNIDLHCDMREGFQMVYTYGTYEIGVNWYPVNGLFQFTFPSRFETIAKIYYPT